MDHLVKTISQVCHDSNIGKGLNCGTTKATAIVKNVLGQHSFETLCDILRFRKFSLIIEEFTNRTLEKDLCLVVRYLDNNYTVKDSFLGLIKVPEGNSNALYNNITNFFIDNNIPYKNNLLGCAADLANFTVHYSLMTLLKIDIPSLFVMKYICHSVHLCASYACEKLPRFIEDLTRDIYNYFGNSPKGISEFSEFQDFCNVKIHKLLHPSQKRCLSVHPLISRILKHYRSLHLYFTYAVAQKDVWAAENILSKLKDPLTKLFLQFLDFVLPFFNKLNLDMQSESPKLHVMYRNVSNVLRTIFDCFIKRNCLENTPLEDINFKDCRNFLSVEEIYFGGNINNTLLEKDLSSEQLHMFRLRCLGFYVEACTQITQRFPLKDNPLKLLEVLDPKVVKSKRISSISTMSVTFSHIVETSLQQLDNEWRLLRNTLEMESLSNDVYSFWKEVGNCKFDNETPMFPNLTDFVFKILCLPHSSANVERIFSKINLMETKERNKLHSGTISALFLTKRLISDDNESNCFKFLVEQKMINSMTNETLYPQ